MQSIGRQELTCLANALLQSRLLYEDHFEVGATHFDVVRYHFLLLFIDKDRFLHAGTCVSGRGGVRAGARHTPRSIGNLVHETHSAHGPRSSRGGRLLLLLLLQRSHGQTLLGPLREECAFFSAGLSTPPRTAADLHSEAILHAVTHAANPLPQIMKIILQGLNSSATVIHWTRIKKWAIRAVAARMDVALALSTKSKADFPPAPLQQNAMGGAPQQLRLTADQNWGTWQPQSHDPYSNTPEAKPQNEPPSASSNAPSLSTTIKEEPSSTAP